jgi:polyhydroxyalkanoate synthase subunit PhaC
MNTVLRNNLAVRPISLTLNIKEELKTMVMSPIADWEDILGPIPDEIKQSLERARRFQEVVTTDPEPLVYQTPKEVIWTKNKAKLYRFASHLEKTQKVPLLLFYALINKPYILDLAPGNSLVEYLVNRGFDVYLLDWGTPGPEDSHMKLDDYIMDYMPRAVKKVLSYSEAEEISVLGYCMGGTLTAAFAALHPNLPIRNLIFMTSPFDFSDLGLYTNWLDERYFNVDKLVDTIGNIPPDMIDLGNKMLKPIINFVGPYVSLADRANSKTFVENWKLMQKWVNDGIPFPGEAFRQWIRDYYQQNKLIKGELIVRGVRVDLSNIQANVLNLGATRDHIAQPKQIEPLMDIISSKDKTLNLMPTGHVSIIFGRHAIKQTYPTIGDWLEARSN